MGYVEKEQGEVMGSQMVEQVSTEEEFSSMLFLLLLTIPLKTWGSELQG